MSVKCIYNTSKVQNKVHSHEASELDTRVIELKQKMKNGAQNNPTATSSEIYNGLVLEEIEISFVL